MVPKTTNTTQVQHHKAKNQKYTCIQVLHSKVRSSTKHFGEIETLIHGLEKLPDVWCLSETWLNSGDDANSLLVL